MILGVNLYDYVSQKHSYNKNNFNNVFCLKLKHLPYDTVSFKGQSDDAIIQRTINAKVASAKEDAERVYEESKEIASKAELIQWDVTDLFNNNGIRDGRQVAEFESAGQYTIMIEKDENGKILRKSYFIKGGCLRCCEIGVEELPSGKKVQEKITYSVDNLSSFEYAIGYQEFDYTSGQKGLRAVKKDKSYNYFSLNKKQDFFYIQNYAQDFVDHKNTKEKRICMINGKLCSYEENISISGIGEEQSGINIDFNNGEGFLYEAKAKLLPANSSEIAGKYKLVEGRWEKV